jgi:hypothetical protein
MGISPVLLALLALASFQASVIAEAPAEADAEPPPPPPSPPPAEDDDVAGKVGDAYSTEAGRAGMVTDTTFAGSSVVELTDLNFRDTVGFGEDLWLVFFYFKDRCPLCYLRSLEVKQASKLLQGTGVRVGAVDVAQKGAAARVCERMKVTGTTLKDLGAAQQEEGKPNPGPAPLLKAFNTTHKITARRGIYEAPHFPVI